ncbi:MAG TPA: hypothetical protein ENH94_09540 [Phycisphaerales bacterium]|nr:hypothetical protein [Phycisphaerales bacterium]
MRYFMVIIFCITSVCLAQETYHDEEYGFTIDIPSNWYISFDDEWSDELKTTHEQHYLSDVLFVLNPLDVEIADSPCIRAFAGLAKKTTRFGFNAFIQRGESVLTRSMRQTADMVLGEKIKQYREINVFYDYEPAKRLAIAKILYKHNSDNTFFMVTRAKSFGQTQSINFQGFSSGVDHEDFWQVFSEVVDSYRFGQVSEVVDSLKFGTEPKSKEEVLNQIWKWGGIILTISIIIGVAKKLLGR